MIVGLWMSLASAENVENTPIHASSLLDVPAQSWEEEGTDDEMLQKHAQSQRNIKLTALYTTGVIALGASGYGFYERGLKLEAYDEAVLEYGSLDHPKVEDAFAESVPYTALAYGGLALGLGLVGGGVVVQVQPTSMSVGFQF